MDAALASLCLQVIRVLNYLDDWLILAHSKATAASHRDVVLVHMRSLGLWVNPEKCELSPSQRTTFLGEIWDSTTARACLSSARVATILAAVNTGGSSQHHSFGPASHEAIPVLAQRCGLPSLQTSSRCHQGYVPRTSYPAYVDKTPVSGLGSHSRGVSPSQDSFDGRLTFGLVCSLGRPPRPGSLGRPSTLVAHKLPGDDGRVSGSETLSPTPQGLPCAGHINREADFLLRQVLRPGEWRLHPQVVESVWRIYGRAEVDLFASEESLSHCLLCLSGVESSTKSPACYKILPYKNYGQCVWRGMVA
ncbi:hypothetical protein QTP70_000121 [Hemibagrus guttatus]|uniref:ribonuclease H n=1 Tax=Hemibagrus guttatus TaxID=175788 RepID=A0AAE0UYJ5_9TELE|nr:hypothetical protein QTP70_000121 [Hemibagrus guttatus]